MINDYPDADLNAWIDAYNAYRYKALADAIISGVVADLIGQIIKGDWGYYTIIIVPDVPESKYTVYYWKYTAYHISQPAPTIPAQDIEVVA